MTDDKPRGPQSPDSESCTDPPSGYQYFASLPRGWTRDRPAGVIRRSRDGDRFDEAFTRNLRWQPTNRLRDYEDGFSYRHDYVEITKEEADAFVREVTAELGG